MCIGFKSAFSLLFSGYVSQFYARCIIAKIEEPGFLLTHRTEEIGTRHMAVRIEGIVIVKVTIN